MKNSSREQRRRQGRCRDRVFAKVVRLATATVAAVLEDVVAEVRIVVTPVGSGPASLVLASWDLALAESLSVQLGSGVAHQLPHLYSQVGLGVVVVQTVVTGRLVVLVDVVVDGFVDVTSVEGVADFVDVVDVVLSVLDVVDFIVELVVDSLQLEDDVVEVLYVVGVVNDVVVFVYVLDVVFDVVDVVYGADTVVDVVGFVVVYGADSVDVLAVVVGVVYGADSVVNEVSVVVTVEGVVYGADSVVDEVSVVVPVEGVVYGADSVALVVV
ncbi:hypothetical protein FGG08_001226 [Glutinoglossum americanum]|uniref:Uncharacterized protein n=1 Tax=Glutinoglossum americanum TaxID=1670608 RepID=A0A9P8L322_9PEZI|nr:hypothetical protein FGG08_001226 [Glutinoglossum americanum]